MINIECDDDTKEEYAPEYKFICGIVEKWCDKYPEVTPDIFEFNTWAASLGLETTSDEDKDDPTGIISYLNSFMLFDVKLERKSFIVSTFDPEWDEDYQTPEKFNFNPKNFSDNVEYNCDEVAYESRQAAVRSINKQFDKLMNFFYKEYQPAYQVAKESWKQLYAVRKNTLDKIRFKIASGV